MLELVQSLNTKVTSLGDTYTTDFIKLLDVKLGVNGVIEFTNLDDLIRTVDRFSADNDLKQLYARYGRYQYLQQQQIVITDALKKLSPDEQSLLQNAIYHKDYDTSFRFYNKMGGVETLLYLTEALSYIVNSYAGEPKLNRGPAGYVNFIYWSENGKSKYDFITMDGKRLTKEGFDAIEGFGILRGAIMNFGMGLKDGVWYIINKEGSLVTADLDPQVKIEGGANNYFFASYEEEGVGYDLFIDLEGNIVQKFNKTTFSVAAPSDDGLSIIINRGNNEINSFNTHTGEYGPWKRS